MKSATTPQYIIAILSVMHFISMCSVFMYRFVYIMIPMIAEGLKKKDLGTILKSLTMLV